MDKILFYCMFSVVLITVCSTYEPSDDSGMEYDELKDVDIIDDIEASPEEFTKPVPYKFQFNHKDKFGTVQHREENKNEDGVVRGSYGYRDSLGMYRHVSYVADADGFHAVLRTNEPGIGNKNSADVAVVAQLPSTYEHSSIQDSENSASDDYR
ncbi:Cuticle protein 16.8 like protein [Argiope bruennichi]|uniref:Cuticle protein 16.8 like protein n=1 Tax=Argiope bruennichi TaxID=94029 RepID=A0A8T0EA67_ARGBR|nr:Cuticle protein 16.8 like protein [Argiope bruennichi]